MPKGDVAYGSAENRRVYGGVPKKEETDPAAAGRSVRRDRPLRFQLGKWRLSAGRKPVPFPLRTLANFHRRILRR